MSSDESMEYLKDAAIENALELIQQLDTLQIEGFLQTFIDANQKIFTDLAETIKSYCSKTQMVDMANQKMILDREEFILDESLDLR